MSIPKDLRCPKCASTDIAEIIYGTDELLRQVQAKKVLIRNEPPPENPPQYYCYYCGYEW
ncbi:MAG: hypothetical protein ACYSPJ_10265 [Planctomycetota bacterium]|jgi:hypothetical protein